MKGGIGPSWRSVVVFLSFSSLNKKFVTDRRTNGTQLQCQACHTREKLMSKYHTQLLTGEQAGVVKVVTCWWRNTCSPHLYQRNPLNVQTSKPSPLMSAVLQLQNNQTVWTIFCIPFAGLVKAFHHRSPLHRHPIISLIYALPSEQSSSTGDPFKHWMFPLQSSRDLEHVAQKHSKLWLLAVASSFCLAFKPCLCKGPFFKKATEQFYLSIIKL